MKIRTKLIVGALCSCLTVLLVGAISYLSFHQLQEKNRQVKLADTITDNVFELDVFMDEYLLYREKRPKVQWETQYQALTRLLQEVEFSDPDKQGLITTMRDNLEKMARLFSDLTATYSPQAADDDEKLTQQLRNRLQSQLLLKSRRMLSYISQLKNDLEHEHLVIQRNASWLTTVFVSVLAIVIVSLGLLIARSINRPLTGLIRSTESIAAGNLDVNIAIDKHDEIGLLSQSFKQMVEQLKTTLISRDQLEKHVNERTAELSESNQKLAEEITDRKQAELDLKQALSEIGQLKDRLEAENIYLRQEITLKYHHKEIIGESQALKEVLSQVEQVAELDSTVLITGETGTGKGLIAHAIHQLSSRKERPMITVNCAVLPSNLIENELFGREKGAYTGALTRQVGRFEIANGSTIFLDEIGELPPDLQAKLLRVLEEGEIEHLGSTKTIKVDVRVIAATNRDLEQAMQEGRFREDLYFRLNVFPLEVPALRERPEDIPLLTWAFVQEFRTLTGKRIESIAQKSLEELQRYSWPGNIRELRNVIERAVILSKSPKLRIDLPALDTSKNSQLMTLEELERQHIIEVLGLTGGRISGEKGAAKILGINPKTLESRMKKLEIPRKNPDISGKS